MARTIAQTKNIRRLNHAYLELKSRDHDEGLALIYGAPGFGKTTAACELYIRERGLLLTANPVWTPSTLLEKLLEELGSDARTGKNSRLLDEAVRLLAESPRPIFVDEIGFVIGNRKVVEILRTLHDLSGCPVLLIGMSSVPGCPGIDKQVKRFPQFADRISQWIEFFPADFSDLQLIAELCCSVQLSEDLLRELLKDTKGNVRQIRVRLAQLQKYGKFNRVEAIDLPHWQKLQAEIEERNKKMRAVG